MRSSFIGFLVWSIWLVFGGVLCSLMWALQGLLFMLTVVGFRRGVACFKVAHYLLYPFDKTFEFEPDDGKPGTTWGFIWSIVLGAWPFGIHIVIGFNWVLTLFGLPFADKHFEAASVCFNPRRVKTVHRKKYAHADIDEETNREFEQWKAGFKGRIFALPYMNCRGRSFKHVWYTLGNFVPMDFCHMMFTHNYYETAKVLVDTYDIQDGDIIVGTCLGGMVAQEFVKLRKLKAMILVASPCSRDDYYSTYRYVTPILLALSDSVFRFIFKSSPAIPPRIAALMNDELGVKNIRKFIIQALAWRGCDLNLPICRIHGDTDFLFPIPPTCDYLINGGHFVGIVNSDICVDSIKKFVVEKHRKGEL